MLGTGRRRKVGEEKIKALLSRHHRMTFLAPQLMAHIKARAGWYLEFRDTRR